MRVAASLSSQARAKHRPDPDRILMPNRHQPRHRLPALRNHDLPSRLRHLINQRQALRPELRRRHRPFACCPLPIRRHVQPLQDLLNKRPASPVVKPHTTAQTQDRPYRTNHPSCASGLSSPLQGERQMPASSAAIGEGSSGRSPTRVQPAVKPSHPTDPTPPPKPGSLYRWSPADAPPARSPQSGDPQDLRGDPPAHQPVRPHRR